MLEHRMPPPSLSTAEGGGTGVAVAASTTSAHQFTMDELSASLDQARGRQAAAIAREARMSQLLEAERKARHETEMRLKAMQDWVGAGRGGAARGSCTSCASLQERLASAELERELAVAEARHGLALASIADANGSNDSAVGHRPTLGPDLESRVAELEAQLEAQDAVSQRVQDELRGQLESLNASSSQNAERAAGLQEIMIQMKTSLATSEEKAQGMSHAIAVAEEANTVLRARAEAAEEALWRARGDFETEKAAWGQECVEVRRRLVAAELELGEMRSSASDASALEGRLSAATAALSAASSDTKQLIEERDELQLALNEVLCASRELVEVRGALAAVEDCVRELDSVSLLLLEEGSVKLEGVSALFSEFFGNAKGLEATVDALKSECEGLTKRCEALEGEHEWERERNACMSARPTMAERSLEFDQAEKKLGIAENGSGTDGPSFDRARGESQYGQHVAESGLGLGEAVSNVEQLACEAESRLEQLHAAVSAVVQNGVGEARFGGLTVHIPEYRAPKAGPQHASPSAGASPMFGARENFVISRMQSAHARFDSRFSPSPEREASAVNFSRERLLDEPGGAGRAPMLGPQHASSSTVASPMLGGRDEFNFSPMPKRESSIVVNFNRDNLLNEPGDAGQGSPLFSLGRARARSSNHGETSNAMGSRPSSDVSEARTEGGSEMNRTSSGASSTNSTASQLHRFASRNVANSMNMLASGRHQNSVSGFDSINSSYAATRSDSAGSDASGQFYVSAAPHAPVFGPNSSESCLPSPLPHSMPYRRSSTRFGGFSMDDSSSPSADSPLLSGLGGRQWTTAQSQATSKDKNGPPRNKGNKSTNPRDLRRRSAENVLQMMLQNDRRARTLDEESPAMPDARPTRPRAHSMPHNELEQHLKAIQEEVMSVKWSTSFDGLTPASSNVPTPRSTAMSTFDAELPMSKCEASHGRAMWNEPRKAWGHASGSASESRAVDKPLNASKISPPLPVPVADPPALPGKTFRDVINPPSPMPAPRRIRNRQRQTRTLDLGKLGHASTTYDLTSPVCGGAKFAPSSPLIAASNFVPASQFLSARSHLGNTQDADANMGTDSPIIWKRRGSASDGGNLIISRMQSADTSEAPRVSRLQSADLDNGSAAAATSRQQSMGVSPPRDIITWRREDASSRGDASVIAELETRLQQRQQENKALADTLALSLEENKQVRQELQVILDVMGLGADTPVAAVASTPGVEAKLRGEIAGYKAVLGQQELHVEQLIQEWNEKEAKLKSLVCDLEGEAGEVCVKVDALEMLVGKAESDVIVLRGHVVERLEKFRERESEIERMEESWFLQAAMLQAKIADMESEIEREAADAASSIKWEALATKLLREIEMDEAVDEIFKVGGQKGKGKPSSPLR